MMCLFYIWWVSCNVSSLHGWCHVMYCILMYDIYNVLYLCSLCNVLHLHGVIEGSSVLL